MKKNETVKNEPLNITSFLTSVICLGIGIILFLNQGILDIIGWVTSGILALYSIIKIFVIIRRKKKNLDVEFGEYLLIVASIIASILIAIFPKSVSISISIVLGIICLVIAINRLILGFTIKKIDNVGSKVFMIESVLIFVVGILIITQKFLSLLGLFLIIYAVSEIISYIYYKLHSSKYDEVLNKKISKEIKNSKAIDAIVDEK